MFGSLLGRFRGKSPPHGNAMEGHADPIAIRGVINDIVTRHTLRAKPLLDADTTLPRGFSGWCENLWRGNLDTVVQHAGESLRSGTPRNLQCHGVNAGINFVVSIAPSSISRYLEGMRSISSEPGLGYLNFLARLSNERPEPNADLLVHWIISLSEEGNYCALTVGLCPPRAKSLLLIVKTNELFNEDELKILAGEG